MKDGRYSNKEHFLRVLGMRGTRDILRYLGEHGTARYKNFSSFMNTLTLNQRLRQLLGYKLIEHHMDRKVKRIEWYTITEKGKKILKHMNEMIKITEEKEE